MQIIKWERTDEKFSDLDLKNRLGICVGIIFFSILSALSLYVSYIGISQNLFFDYESYYISESGILVPAILLSPFPLLMLLAGVQKVCNYKNEKTFFFMIRIMVFAIPICFFLMIVSSFYVEASLKNHGYTYCSWYKYSPTRSPDVWLKNSELCLKVHHYVVSDIEEWFEWHNEQGIEPQLDELKAFIAKVNKDQGR